MTDALVSAIKDLTAEIRAERDERKKLATNVDALQQTVSRFVIAMERQLSSGQAVQRNAERYLNSLSPEKVKEMNAQLARKFGRK